MSLNGTPPHALMLEDAMRRLALAESRLSQLGSDLSEIGAAQQDMHKSVTLLRDQLSTQQGDGDDGTGIVDWSSLTRKQAVKAWANLYSWLDEWLVPVYGVQVRTLLPCWPHHPAVREELSWLRCAWMQAYRRPSSTASAAAEWHTRWRPAALSSIGGWFEHAGCNGGVHGGTPLPEHLRAADPAELSLRQWWMDDGREADIAARTSP